MRDVIAWAVTMSVLACTFIDASLAQPPDDANPRAYVATVKARYHETAVQTFEEVAQKYEALDLHDIASYFRNLLTSRAWHGTGFVWVDENGENYVITNRHVVNQASTVDLVFENAQGRETPYYDCPIEYVSDDFDLAIVRFPGREKVFKSGFSIDTRQLRDGQKVISLGYPGLGSRPTWQFAMGNVSNAYAKIPEIQEKEYVIQHTAPIDPGNSGGPLVIESSDSPTGYSVVAVNTWSFSSGKLGAAARENTFFSIPASVLMSVVADAGAAEKVHADAATTVQELQKNCKILTAELSSSSMDQLTLDRYISYEWVGKEGYTIFVALTSLFDEDRRNQWWQAFTQDPVGVMRLAIFYAFWLTYDGHLVKFDTINYADEVEILEKDKIRTNFLVDRNTRAEVEWVYEYGHWKVSHAPIAIAGFSEGGAATGGGGGGGGGEEKEKAPVGALKKGQWIIGLQGGVSIPFGYLADDEGGAINVETSGELSPVEGPVAGATTGGSFDISIAYMLSSKFALGAFFNYNAFGVNDNYLFTELSTDITNTISQFGLNARFFVSESKNALYLLGGVASFSQNATGQGSGFVGTEPVYWNYDVTNDSFGIQLGLGFMFSPSNTVRIPIEVVYNRAFDSQTEDTTDANGNPTSTDLGPTQFLMVQAGVWFSVGEGKEATQ